MNANPQFRLQLLGGWSLRRAASDDTVDVTARKARALVAYIAMQAPMRAGRERLATLLWPDRVDRQARQNLRKCIATLRQDLGPRADELLVIDNGTVGIRDGLVVDAHELRDCGDAAGMAELEHAAALYRGQFLADLPMEGEEFLDWAAAERAQLDAAAGAILARLGDRADQAGDGQKALAAASRLTAIDPFREDWQRLSLRLSARHVGRDQALRQAKSFVALLRKELDVAPEAETAALIDEIRAGRVLPIRKPDVPVDGSGERALPSHRRGQQAAEPVVPPIASAGRHPAAAAAAFIAAAIVLLIAYLALAGGPQPWLDALKAPSLTTAAADPSTIPLRVMPFQSASAESAALAGALTESLLTSLSRFSGLTVFDGRASALARSGGARPEVRFASWGSVRQDGSLVHVNVGLNDTTDQTVVWASELTASADRVDALDTGIARRIARDLKLQATYAQARGLDAAALDRAPLSQLIAKALTIRLRGAPRVGEPTVTALYEEALRRDPNSTAALIGLAAEFIIATANLASKQKPSLDRAQQLLGQALLIEPQNEAAHYWLGNLYLGRNRRVAALQEFKRAVELNPAHAPAQAHVGFTLVLMGRANQGLGYIENALDKNAHDPDERNWLRFAGIAQIELGNDTRAIESLLQAAALAAPSPLLREALTSAYALTGQRAKSQEQFRLMKAAANPAALDQLLQSLSRNASAHSLRFWQGLQLAANDSL